MLQVTDNVTKDFHFFYLECILLSRENIE